MEIYLSCAVEIVWKWSQEECSIWNHRRLMKSSFLQRRESFSTNGVVAANGIAFCDIYDKRESEQSEKEWESISVVKHFICHNELWKYETGNCERSGKQFSDPCSLLLVQLFIFREEKSWRNKVFIVFTLPEAVRRRRNSFFLWELGGLKWSVGLWKATLL